MARTIFIYFCLTGDFLRALILKDLPILGSKDNPRVVSIDELNAAFSHHAYQNHSVFLYHEESEETFVAGTDFALELDVADYHTIETFPLMTTGRQCEQGGCQNVITVIEKFQDSPFVCGTNSHEPQCWKLFSSVSNRSHEIMESYETSGISPFTYTQNSLSLTVEGDLYSAAPLDTDGRALQFRRKAGSRTHVWMHDMWLSEPTFISASWVKRKEDPENEKIYVFFREKNSDHSPEADPWISRVARVCKVDEGGSKRFLQNIWTSFLKARLVCGFPAESLYFNRLQDIYVMHAEDWHDTRVYALFTSSWNSTAVCIYSIGMIEEIFENSTFKGYDKEIPNPRPGMCVEDSRRLPLATVKIVKDHPEMTDWAHSMHHTAPFYVSSNNYTKIAVDRVQAADQSVHNVLLLSTDCGKIHKVLETGSKAFIISETRLSLSSDLQSPIHLMKLDSKKKRLVVGFSGNISIVDLQKCHEYNKSCEGCVLAQDPYCAWTKSGCTSTVPGGIQNIMDGNVSVCTSVKEQKQVQRTKRQTVSPSPLDLGTVHLVPLGVPFYLSCPIDSYHAVYTWEHGDQISPCLQMQSNCLHLIPAMAYESYGHYTCVSEEKGYRKVVKNYHLKEHKIPHGTERDYTEFKAGDASAVEPHIWISLALPLAMMGIGSGQSDI